MDKIYLESNSLEKTPFGIIRCFEWRLEDFIINVKYSQDITHVIIKAIASLLWQTPGVASIAEQKSSGYDNSRIL